MPYNPYQMYQQNPYGQPMYGFSQPQQPQQNTYAFVNGIEGAKSYPMQPNQTVMLMDSDNPIAYMKQSNGMGQSTLKYFKLIETTEADLRGQSQQKPSVEYALKSDFEALSAKVESLLKKGE